MTVIQICSFKTQSPCDVTQGWHWHKVTTRPAGSAPKKLNAIKYNKLSVVLVGGWNTVFFFAGGLQTQGSTCFLWINCTRLLHWCPWWIDNPAHLSIDRINAGTNTHYWRSLKVCHHAAGSDPPGSKREKLCGTQALEGGWDSAYWSKTILLLPSFCAALSSLCGTDFSRSRVEWSARPSRASNRRQNAPLGTIAPPPPPALWSFLLWIVRGASFCRRSSEEVSWTVERQRPERHVNVAPWFQKNKKTTKNRQLRSS